MFVIVVLLCSLVYLDYTKIDYEHELDSYHVGLEVSKRTSVINDYHPETKYIHNKIDVASHLENSHILSSEIENKVTIIRTFDRAACAKDMALETGCGQYAYNSLNEYIEHSKNERLTHIVADGDEIRPQFIKDVFHNEEKFPYLTKIYDSSEQGYDYHIKIFRINYEKFDSMK